MQETAVLQKGVLEQRCLLPVISIVKDATFRFSQMRGLIVITYLHFVVLRVRARIGHG
jgi:hypothetical protein